LGKKFSERPNEDPYKNDNFDNIIKLTKKSTGKSRKSTSLKRRGDHSNNVSPEQNIPGFSPVRTLSKKGDLVAAQLSHQVKKNFI